MKIISVQISVYKGDNIIHRLSKTNAIVPEREYNLIYFKWRVPTGLNNADIKITAEIVDNSNSYNEVTRSYSTIPFKVMQTPDTQFEKKGPLNFRIPADTDTQASGSEWWEYIYKNGKYEKRKYYSGFGDATIFIEPKNTQLSSKKNGVWEMKSGYGITMTLNNEMRISKSGFSTSPTDSYTAPQYGVAYYPEYGYSKNEGKVTTLL